MKAAGLWFRMLMIGWSPTSCPLGTSRTLSGCLSVSCCLSHSSVCSTHGYPRCQMTLKLVRSFLFFMEAFNREWLYLHLTAFTRKGPFKSKFHKLIFWSMIRIIKFFLRGYKYTTIWHYAVNRSIDICQNFFNQTWFKK